MIRMMLLVLPFVLIGCSGQPVSARKSIPSTNTSQLPVSASAQTPAPPPAILAQPNAPTEAATGRLDQPFETALAPETPLAKLPPPRLVSGKSVGKIYDQVKKTWPTIRFQDAQGKQIHYQVTLETEKGNIVLEMLPEAAPNHVRNFLALTKAGYYDGLRFETRIGEKSATSPKAIAGGSPLGDGDDIVSVGYWLQHEILNEETAARQGIRHVAGMVGAVHVQTQPNTACCRFYICLNEAKDLDGEFTIFAKVTQGLDVAEKIFHCPAEETAEGPKPFTQPIIIKKATVSVKE